jgi:exonuclease VII small subunit
MYSSTNEINQRKRTKSSESTSTSILTTLLERYERTLKERQQAIAIINNQSLDIDDVLKRYRQKIENLDKVNSSNIYFSQVVQENHSFLPRMIKDKYRTMPEITNEDMIQGYIPSPRLYITHTPIDSSYFRQPRFDYYDLSLTNDNRSSAWIRFNEQRIDQLQKRLDLLLQIDDDNQLIFSTDTVTQRIDDILMKKSSRVRNHVLSYHKRIRKKFHFSYLNKIFL